MDKIRQIKNEVKLMQWSEMVIACQSSDKNASEWCRDNNINLKTYNYRLRKVRDATCERIEEHQIVPLKHTEERNTCQITIKKSEISVEISPGASSEMIRVILEALKC